MSDTVQLSILLWDGLIFSLSYEQYFLSHLEHFFLQILMSLNLLTCLDLLIRFCNGWIVVIIPLLVHHFGTIDPVLANELVYLTVRVLQMFHWASQRVKMCSHFSQLILPVASATHTYASTKGTKLCTLHFKQRRVIKVPDTLLTVHSLTLCKVVVIDYHLLSLAWTPIQLQSVLHYEINASCVVSFDVIRNNTCFLYLLWDSWSMIVSATHHTWLRYSLFALMTESQTI